MNVILSSFSAGSFCDGSEFLYKIRINFNTKHQTFISNLLFLVFVHFSQSQEVFDQEHEVDSAQSRQAFPHAVHVLLVVMVKGLGVVQVMVVVVRVMVVVVIPMRLKTRKQNASTTLQLLHSDQHTEMI